jgi:hypothetical protein
VVLGINGLFTKNASSESCTVLKKIGGGQNPCDEKKDFLNVPGITLLKILKKIHYKSDVFH